MVAITLQRRARILSSSCSWRLFRSSKSRSPFLKPSFKRVLSGSGWVTFRSGENTSLGRKFDVLSGLISPRRNHPRPGEILCSCLAPTSPRRNFLYSLYTFLNYFRLGKLSSLEQLFFSNLFYFFFSCNFKALLFFILITWNSK